MDLKTFGTELAAAINAEFDDDPTTEEQGNLYTFVADGALSVPTPEGVSIVLERGSVLEVTPEAIEAARDRTGHSWLEHIDADLRFTRGEPSTDLRAELEAATAELQKAEDLRLLRERHQYGAKAEARRRNLPEEAAAQAQWAKSIRNSKES